MSPTDATVPSRPSGDIWTLDEYVVVADLYIRRGRSSGTRDPEVTALAQLTGRTPASISRRLGNFDGNARPGMGLKPVTGEPAAVFEAMRADAGVRLRMTEQATLRLAAKSAADPARTGLAPEVELVPPESNVVEQSVFEIPQQPRELRRVEAQLVARYRAWRDPGGTRLRGVVIRAEDGTLRADLFDRELGLLVEAKATPSRVNVRYAVGQLLDYRRHFEKLPDIAVLLPTRLSQDLERYLRAVGAEAIWEDVSGFTDSRGGLLSSQG